MTLTGSSGLGHANEIICTPIYKCLRSTVVLWTVVSGLIFVTKYNIKMFNIVDKMKIT